MLWLFVKKAAISSEKMAMRRLTDSWTSTSNEDENITRDCIGASSSRGTDHRAQPWLQPQQITASDVRRECYISFIYVMLTLTLVEIGYKIITSLSTC